jgi:hypothetical protein
MILTGSFRMMSVRQFAGHIAIGLLAELLFTSAFIFLQGLNNL